MRHALFTPTTPVLDNGRPFRTIVSPRFVLIKIMFLRVAHGHQTQVMVRTIQQVRKRSATMDRTRNQVNIKVLHGPFQDTRVMRRTNVATFTLTRLHTGPSLNLIRPTHGPLRPRQFDRSSRQVTTRLNSQTIPFRVNIVAIKVTTRQYVRHFTHRPINVTTHHVMRLNRLFTPRLTQRVLHRIRSRLHRRITINLSVMITTRATTSNGRTLHVLQISLRQV